MLLPISAGISIIILLLSLYIFKKISKKEKLLFLGVFTIFLIIYISEIYLYLINYNEKISEYILRTTINLYLVFGIFITSLILSATKYKMEDEKNILLFFYCVLLAVGITITYLIQFYKKDLIYPPLRYQLFLYFIFFIIILFNFYLVMCSMEKNRVSVELPLFFLSFLFMIFFTFISFILLFQFKKNFFSIIYIIQSSFLFFAFYNYKDIKVLKEKEKKKEEFEEKFIYRNIYIINEKLPKKIYDIFKEIKNNSLFFTRKFPGTIKEKYNANFIWISTTEDAKVETIIPTNLARLLSEVKTFTFEEEERVIFIDDLNYLIFQNGFESVYRIINSLNEIAVVNKAIVFISVDGKQLGKEEIIKLEREGEVI